VEIIHKLSALVAVAGVLFVVGYRAIATEESLKKEARVTRVIQQVSVLEGEATPRPAVVDETVREGSGVRTGPESRSELTFEDLTITRLGANTVFTFDQAGRRGELNRGSILLRVPKNSEGAEFKTEAVTAGITGTTIILEAIPEGRTNLFVLEGEAGATLNKHPKQRVEVQAGYVINVKAGAVRLPRPKRFDVARLMKTSPLINDFAPLPSQDLIEEVIKTQQPPTRGSSGPSPRVMQSPAPTPLPPGPTPPPPLSPSPSYLWTPPITPRPTSTMTPTPTATVRLTATPTVTPTPTPQWEPPTPTPTPTLTVRSTATPTVTATPRVPREPPTPTPYISKETSSPTPRSDQGRTVMSPPKSTPHTSPARSPKPTVTPRRPPPHLKALSSPSAKPFRSPELNRTPKGGPGQQSGGVPPRRSQKEPSPSPSAH
jgi:hypothetical protein